MGDIAASPLNIMQLVQTGVLALVALILGLFVVRPILTSNRLTPALLDNSGGNVANSLTGPDGAIIDGIATPPADAALEPADWETVLATLDSMVVALEMTSYRLANPAPKPDSAGWAIPPEGFPVYDDAILMARLAAIPTPINMAFNSNVRSWIKMYTLRNREGVQRMMGLTPHYFPMIEPFH